MVFQEGINCGSRINTYDPDVFNEFVYVSDSNRVFPLLENDETTGNNPLAKKLNGLKKLWPKNFQLLIHPMWWVYDNQTTEEELIDIIQKKDPTYSPLALNFIIDNEIVNDKIKVNELFDIIIEKTNIENEIKNLIIYKKALYNSDNINENDLINILNPILNSESVWKSHSLYLLAEYFLSKNEKQKSKEFLVQIIELENANPKIKVEAQKRINRDLSD